MARYAIIVGGVVENTTEWDGVSDWSPPDGATIIAEPPGGVASGWGYDGNSFAPPPPPPSIARKVDVAAGFATVASGAISNVEGFGFSGATRVALGRIRFFFSEPQPDANYLAQVTVRHNADVMARINGQTASYVEVKTNSIEATGYNVEVVRIIR